MKILVGAIGFLGSYYLAAQFCLQMASLDQQAITVVWLPAGLSVVAFMVFRWWATPLVWAASLAFGHPGLMEGGSHSLIISSLISASGETVQSALVWRLFRNDLPEGLASVGDLARFCILACFVPIMLGGFELAFKLLADDATAWQHVPLAVLTGGVADTLGILITVPALWAWRDRALAMEYEKTWITLFSVLIVGILYASLRERPFLIFFSIPVLFSLAMRTGLRGSVVGHALLVLGLIVATVRGEGFFAAKDEFRAYIDLLAYVGALGFATMALAVGYTKVLAEKGRLTAALEAQRVELERAAAEHRKLQEQGMQRTHYDELTSLPNRAMFYDRLQQAIVHARRRSTRFALLFIDLDGFKPVNDTWGHEAGDMLLRQVGERLRNCVRESDTVARMGGDEFTVIVSDICFRRSAIIVADKVIASLSTPFLLAGNETRISASIGISIYPDDAEQAELLLNHADAAMYAVKRLGKNNRGFYAADTVFSQPIRRA